MPVYGATYSGLTWNSFINANNFSSGCYSANNPTTCNGALQEQMARMNPAFWGNLPGAHPDPYAVARYEFNMNNSIYAGSSGQSGSAPDSYDVFYGDIYSSSVTIYAGAAFLQTNLQSANPQEPWVFNWGIHDFTQDERERLRQAFEKVKGDACRKWFEATIKKLGPPDLSVNKERPQTMDKLLEYAEFNKYNPKLTAKDMRISEDRRQTIADKYENRWTNLTIANAVTLAPDYTRVYLMPSAFWQDTTLAPFSGHDLSGIITFELLHVAGYGDDKIWELRDKLQQVCGNPSDLL